MISKGSKKGITLGVGPRFSPRSRRRRRRGMILCFCLGLFLLGWVGNLRGVLIAVEGEERQVWTLSRQVNELLVEQGIELGEFDRVLPGRNALLKTGMTVEVLRAFPVSITSDGETTQWETSADTVRELLRQAQITLGPLDQVAPGLDAAVLPGLEIGILRVHQHLEKVTQSIPFEVTRWAEPTLERGKTSIIRQGQEGIKELTYRLTLENGREVHRELIGEEVVQIPRSQILGIGTKEPVLLVQTPMGPLRYRTVLEMEATAYYPGPESTGVWADGITSIGLPAGHGVVAVDPKVIPLRSRLYIPGYGQAVAGDIGGAIRGNIIDLGFDTYREAIQFGRRKVQVYILY